MTTKENDGNLPLAVTSTDEIKRAPTLSRRLLTWLLPATIAPLLIATGIEYNIARIRSEEQAFAKLQGDSLLASEEVGIFLNKSLKTHDLIGSYPLVTEAIKSGTKIAQEQNLSQQPIAVVEQKFASNKLIQNNQSLNNYLKQLVQKTETIAEIIITDKNGFNVAYSSPTSDFVQSDESWWLDSQKTGKHIAIAEFDQSSNTRVFPVSKAIQDPNSGEFLGVIKIGITSAESDQNLSTYLTAGLGETEIVQVINLDKNDVEQTITKEGSQSEGKEVIGGEVALEVGNIVSNAATNSLSLAEIRQEIEQIPNVSLLKLNSQEIKSQTYVLAEVKYAGKIYAFTSIPGLKSVAIASIDFAEILAKERSLLLIFGATAVILGIASTILITLLAQRISSPLTVLSGKTEQVAEGNLDVVAEVEGTRETKTLASNFNLLVKQVKNLLQEQKDIADQQTAEKEKLEMAIFNLLDEVSDATDGDLTVRANLDSMELSTVADLFNAIIDNLQDIAIEAKESSNQVGSSLKKNEQAIRLLSEQAIAEAKETRDTLVSVEQMSQSIQAVSENASQAEQITDDTYNTIVLSTNNMDMTVESILELRSTVGETAKKMKRLGESSQKISQAVSFIEEIALKTNVLAINASVEAGRAGEYGQGFTIVAEQVGALAEQSAAATKEIAMIVAAIQSETQEVNQAMESGTTQVVETTRLLENTKQSLNLVLEKSQEVNQLMGSISQSTVSQADTSENITQLMQKIASLSEITSQSSAQVVQSIVETAQVAARLESTVGQFKVAE